MRLTVDGDLIGYDMSDTRSHALGSWITGDVGSNFIAILDALAAVAEVGSGEADRADLNFGGWDVAVHSDRVEFVMDAVSRRQTYPLAEVRGALEELWTLSLRYRNHRDPEVTYHYRTDLAPAWADLLSWEETYGPHPYRGRIGIPETGPE